MLNVFVFARNCIQKRKNFDIYVLAFCVCFIFSVFAMPSFASPSSSKIDLPSEYANSGTIKYCVQLSNPPRTYTNIQGEFVGTGVDVAQAMADVLGLKVDWLGMKFAALIPALLGGQCDMIVAELFIKPKRAEVIDYVPFTVSTEQIVVRKGNPHNIQNMDDLAGKNIKVAVPNGVTFQSLIQQENKRRQAAGKPLIDVLAVPTTRDMFHLLSVGVVDAAGATNGAAAYYLKKTHGRLVPAGEPFHRIYDGFALREEDDGLRHAMSKALHQVVKSGKYEEIFKKYGLENAIIDPSSVEPEQQ